MKRKMKEGTGRRGRNRRSDYSRGSEVQSYPKRASWVYFCFKCPQDIQIELTYLYGFCEFSLKLLRIQNKEHKLYLFMNIGRTLHFWPWRKDKRLGK